jgi:uncharacterized damage-inducible protein DinB
MNIETEFLEEIRTIFRSQKNLLDKTLSQVTDDQLFWQYNTETNSIAINLKHLAGNMLSRWTNFLTEDGEKTDRHRDSEFITEGDTGSSLREYLEKGYGRFFETLDSLTETDLDKIITIRGEPHTVVKALIRQVSHYGYHVGQVVHIAKEIKAEAWQTLSIARGKSSDYVAVPFKGTWS